LAQAKIEKLFRESLGQFVDAREDTSSPPSSAANCFLLQMACSLLSQDSNGFATLPTAKKKTFLQKQRVERKTRRRKGSLLLSKSFRFWLSHQTQKLFFMVERVELH